MDLADASLLQVLVAGKAAILAARVEKVAQDEVLANDTHVGVVRVRVERVLTPDRWHGPDSFDLKFAQFARPAQRAKEWAGWNRIDVAPDLRILLALPDAPKDPPPPPLSAVAVTRLASDTDPLLRAVEEALRIEATADANRREELLRAGLYGQLDFLRAYCRYATGRLKRVPRDRAVALELALLTDTDRSVSDRLAAQANLDLELWKHDDPDDGLNKRILSAFFRGLGASEPDLRRANLRSIHRHLFEGAPEGPDGPAHRDRLLAGVTLPDLGPLRELRQDPELQREAASVERAIESRKSW